MKNTHFVIVLFVSIIISGCKDVPEPVDPINSVLADIQLLSPANKEQYTVGEQIDVKIKINNAENVSDLKVIYDNKLIEDGLAIKDQTISISTDESKVGNLKLFISYLDKNGQEHQDVRTITVFSDVEPQLKVVKVVSKFAHNPKSYTQGLEFYKGNLFESTGQYGSSFIGEIDLKSGVIKRQVDLDDTYFGEGITILKDTIYQITYKSQICKVYDLNFNFIKEFTYTGEGWGLTNNGSQLLMTNGSDEIVWRNRNTFAVEKSIQVFDDKSNIAQLNELEIINGSLYSNIYTDNRLAEIDTTTGKVLSYIDCSSIVLEQPVGVDYFNGIAYNSLSDKIYVTGKLWPTLYQITFE